MTETAATSTQFCTFRLDGLLFGIEVMQVQEVIRYQAMTAVPLADGIVAGLINLRGQIVTAVDLRRRLEMPDRAAGHLPMNVVVQMPEGPVSLLVDEIGDVIDVDQNSYEPCPETVRGVARDVIRGAFKTSGPLLLALDTRRAIEAGAAN